MDSDFEALQCELEILQSGIAALVWVLSDADYRTPTDSVAALDDIRMRIKYLRFDAEATRRENRYLRDLLDHGKGGMHQPM